MAELEPAVLPITVAGSHLQACAAALANAPATRLDDLLTVLGHVVTGQRQLAQTFDRLAERVHDGREQGVSTGAADADLAALAEVLRSAATAFGCSAAALSESAPLVRTIAETVGVDTRL